MLSLVRQAGQLFVERSRGEALVIDLGTAATKCRQGKQPLKVVPTAAVVHAQSRAVLTVGAKAEQLVGKTSPQFAISHPIQGGAVADTPVLEHFLEQICAADDSFKWIPHWRRQVVAACPSLVSPAHRRQLQAVFRQVGLTQSRLIDTGWALQAGLRQQQPTQAGLVIVEVGAAVTSVVVPNSDWQQPPQLAVSCLWGGHQLTDKVKAGVRTTYGCDIGWLTAEQIKTQMSLLTQSKKSVEPVVTVRGQNITTRLPMSIKVETKAFQAEFSQAYRQIAHFIKKSCAQISVEKSASPLSSGILLTGGASQSSGLAAYLEKDLQVSVTVSRTPLADVAQGLWELKNL